MKEKVNQLRVLKITAILFAFALIVFLSWQYLNNKSVLPTTTSTQIDFFTSPDRPIKIGEHNPQKWFPQTYKPESTLPPPLPEEKKLASEKLKKEFARVAKLTIPYPKEMHFREIDLDPNMLAISGFNFLRNTNLTLIVRRGTVPPSEVLLFLKESIDLIPNLSQEVIDNFPKPDYLDINPHNGLVDNTLWEVKTKEKSYYFLFANRKDKKGCYLAIFSGSIYGVNIDSPEIFKISDEIKAEN